MYREKAQGRTRNNEGDKKSECTKKTIYQNICGSIVFKITTCFQIVRAKLS